MIAFDVNIHKPSHYYHLSVVLIGFEKYSIVSEEFSYIQYVHLLPTPPPLHLPPPQPSHTHVKRITPLGYSDEN